MFNLHATRKLLERLKPTLQAPARSTTALGDWYATALFWKPQMALLVNERTLLPVLMPLAPASTLAQRFPQALAQVLQALDVDQDFIAAELAQMTQATCCKTSNRSVLGVMNEFVYLAEGIRELADGTDGLAMSLRLARTPCSPLHKGAVFPDKALHELVASGGLH